MSELETFTRAIRQKRAAELALLKMENDCLRRMLTAIHLLKASQASHRSRACQPEHESEAWLWAALNTRQSSPSYFHSRV